VWATLIGFTGVAAAALLALMGVLRSSRPPAHLADVEGMSKLLDQTQEDRNYWRDRAKESESALRECQQEAARLREELR
jgi:hypothetical protein